MCKALTQALIAQCSFSAIQAAELWLGLKETGCVYHLTGTGLRLQCALPSHKACLISQCQMRLRCTAAASWVSLTCKHQREEVVADRSFYNKTTWQADTLIKIDGKIITRKQNSPTHMPSTEQRRNREKNGSRIQIVAVKLSFSSIVRDSWLICTKGTKFPF